MDFDLLPYEGAGPLRFGMTAADASAAIGVPLRSNKTRRGEMRYWYANLVLVVDLRGQLAEITFMDNARLVVEGIEVFETPNALLELAKRDGSPLEMVGIVFFPKLGITLSGFHTEEEKTITALARGRVDHLLPDFKPFKVPEQRLGH